MFVQTTKTPYSRSKKSHLLSALLLLVIFWCSSVAVVDAYPDERIEETSEAELVAVVDELPGPNCTVSVCDETNSKNW